MNTDQEKIRVIKSINAVIEMYQQRCLSVEDFDELYELDIDQLWDVEKELIHQSRQDMTIQQGDV